MLTQMITQKEVSKSELSNILNDGEYIGIRKLRESLTKVVQNDKKTFFVTSHGKPVKVLLPYGMLLEILEVLDELKDERLIQKIDEAMKEYAKGGWIPINKLKKYLGL